MTAADVMATGERELSVAHLEPARDSPRSNRF
jgi:hypothetical protein